jgi:FkbM family methyltransferase
MSLRSNFSGFLRSQLRRSGREIVPYDEEHFPALHRRRLMTDRGITVVLDIGANMGQTGEELREFGYTGKIVSFEPLSEPFDELSRHAKSDGRWQVRQCAMGDTQGNITINISGTHHSSSILPMNPRHESMVPASVYVGTQEVPICRVDDLFAEYVSPNDRVLLKADTQGYEAAVLRGAATSLPKISLVQLELSFVPLYESQPKHYEIMKLMDEAGFDLVGMLPLFLEQKTCHFLQADALFARRETV